MQRTEAQFMTIEHKSFIVRTQISIIMELTDKFVA